MRVKQLSIFLENKTGVINEVTDVLSKNGINMVAFSVAEGIEFGILRLIVSDVELAKEKLQEARFKVNITEVLGINVPNTPGALDCVLEYLAKENVFIQYMYAFSEGDVCSTVIKPTDMDKCEEILAKYTPELQAKDAIYKF